MQTKLEALNSYRRRVTVEVDSTEVNEIFSEVLNKFQKKAKINGFRQGKAPISYIKTHFADHIALEVADTLVRKYLFSALEQNKVMPISVPEVDNINLPKENESYTFSVNFEVLPNIELPNYKGMEIEIKPLMKVSEQQIEERLKYLQDSHAQRKALGEDIPLDIVHDVAIELSVHSSEHPSIQSPKTKVVYINFKDIDLYPSLIQKISKEVMGLKTNEKKTLTIQSTNEELLNLLRFLQSDSSDIDIQKSFVPNPNEPFNITVDVKIDTIFEKTLPPLDDNFAKEFKVNSLEELKQQIRNKLENYYQSINESYIHSTVMDTLSNMISLEVPNSIIEKNIDFLIDKYLSPRVPKSELSKIKSNVSYRDSFREEATKISKSHLILMAIIKQENISVSDEELEEYLSKYLDKHETSSLNSENNKSESRPNLLKNIKLEDKEALKDQFLIKKAFSHILDNVKLVEKAEKNT